MADINGLRSFQGKIFVSRCLKNYLIRLSRSMEAGREDPSEMNLLKP